MTTLTASEKLYRFYNKCADCRFPLYLNRHLDNICSVERLCYKVAKAVLREPDKEVITITLKNKQSDWLNDRRIFSIALIALKVKYGSIDLKVEGLNLTIIWKSLETPVLNEQDHLNCKLFKAIVSNKNFEVKKLLNRGADSNAVGPFTLRPLQAVLSNLELSYLLLYRGANPDSF